MREAPEVKPEVKEDRTDERKPELGKDYFLTRSGRVIDNEGDVNRLRGLNACERTYELDDTRYYIKRDSAGKPSS